MADRSYRHTGNLVNGEVFQDRSFAEASVCGIHQGLGASCSQREAGYMPAIDLFHHGKQEPLQSGADDICH